MDFINKNYIGHVVLVVGLVFYCCYINAFDFIPATIIMMTSLLLWLAFNVYFDILDRFVFSKILTISGFILSISIFLLFGIEQVPFPEGAILFHGIGIAASLFAFFMSLFPLLFISRDYIEPAHTPNLQPSHAKQSERTTSIDNEWELATDEDVESGEFEIAA